VQSSEHRQVGNVASKNAADGPRPPGTPPVTAEGYLQLTVAGAGLADVPLTYGEIVALGGDFYGVVGNPISSGPDPSEVFATAHESLLHTDRTELKKIMKIMDFESGKVLGVKDPAAAFTALGNSLSYQWNEATGGAKACEGAIGMAQKPGRYARLASNNMDHFGADAVTAYRAGHEAACQIAAHDLNAALLMNAHADHFLSDLFASGHIRTPRRALDEYAWIGCSPTDRAMVGSLCSLAMHNEENITGLHVTSRSGRSWISYGDSWILEDEAADNYAAAVEALRISIREVFDCALGSPAPPPFAALDQIPDVPGDYPPTAGPSIAPMLVATGDGPAERSGCTTVFGQKVPTPGLGSTSDYWYTTDFTWPAFIGETLGQGYVTSARNGDFIWIGK
jgi:hypothetical protein